MIHYLIHNEDGSIMQRGTCASEEEIPAIPGKRSEMVDATDPRGPGTAPEPTYREFRHMDYPPLGDQLDALWRLVQANDLAASDPAAKEMLDRVRAVKARFPKEAA